METKRPITQADRHSMMRSGITMLLQALDCPLDDPNFVGTPDRVARAFEEMTTALRHPELVDKVLEISFPTQYPGMIVVPDVPAVSLCPHHLLPVEYKISFGYIPEKEHGVVGLSKIPRFIRLMCQKPALQEDITKEIADVFEKHVKPMGVGVVATGVHSCVRTRGVQVDVPTITSVVRGVFFDVPTARSEFLSLLAESRQNGRR